jgi:hypothetical protein
MEYPAVSYAYQVGGQAFQGTRIAPGPETSGSDAHRRAAPYVAGAAATIMWVMLAIFNCVLCVSIPLVWWLVSRQ